MPEANTAPTYVIVSPVKDEERYVELTIKSVVAQTVRPALWVIVDDGSTDRTSELFHEHLVDHSFIRLVRNPHAGIRQPGSAVMRAFSYGYEFAKATEHDFVVKLDCDLSFEPDYFEKLLDRFREDKRLGIASGIYLESNADGAWKPVEMPSYHAAGASKVVRAECYREIGGFIIAPGWDTVDEIRAMARGWTTRHFASLQMKHHKSEGTGIGLIRTSVMHGEIYCLTGGDRLFFLLKVLHRITKRPFVIGALALAWGYLRARWKRMAPLVSKAEAECYRALLRDRVQSHTRALFARVSPSGNR